MSLHKKTITLVTLLTLTAPTFLLSMNKPTPKESLPSNLKWKSVEFNNKTTQIAKNPKNCDHIYEKNSQVTRIIKFSGDSTNKKSMIYSYIPNEKKLMYIITPGKNVTFIGKIFDVKDTKLCVLKHSTFDQPASKLHALFTNYYKTLNKNK